MNAPHAPHACDGKVIVKSSDFMTRLIATLVYKETGTCEKCGAAVTGFASYTKAGVRIGVAYWFSEPNAPIAQGEQAFDPPV